MHIGPRTTVDTRALSAFLQEHLGAIERNDVGPLIGQAALIGERGAASVFPLSGESEWNAALSSEASIAREPSRSTALASGQKTHTR